MGNNLIETIENDIYAIQPEFANVATDKAISFAKEAEFAMQALKSNDYMMNAARNNPESLRNAVINIAAIGITLNPSQKLAYLVPRKVKAKRDGQVIERVNICLDISYRGLAQLALQSDCLRVVKAEVICDGEQFVMRGIDQEPIHEFDPLSERLDAKVTGAYCVAKTVHGDYITEVMSVHEINKIRDNSEAWRNEKGREYGPWARFYQEMCKKTVIKRASKLWPKGEKSSRFDNAIQYLNENGEGLSDKQVTIPISDTLAEIQTCTDYNELGRIWKSVNKLLPAKTQERDQVRNAVLAKKQELRPVVDVQPNEPETAQ